MTVTALRREVEHYLMGLGARRHVDSEPLSRPGTRFYYLPVPGVPRHHDNVHEPFLQIEVTVRGQRSQLAMDRLFVHRLDDRVEPWFADTWADYLPPVTDPPAAGRRALGGWLSRWQFGCGTYSYRPARTGELMDLLSRWVAQELAWQALPDAAEYCLSCNREETLRRRRARAEMLTESYYRAQAGRTELVTSR